MGAHAAALPMRRCVRQGASIARSIMGRLVLALAPGLLLAGTGHASTVTADPQLRIEAGMHTTPIKSVDTDAAGRYAVTVADDKTARVWDLATGRLQRVLRPPIGPDNEGKLFAVALSPDGGTVAAAGWTQIGGEKGHAVYLFDRASGRMTGRLQGAGNVVNRLAFSPDGRWLAATLGRDQGLRVWDWRAATPPLVDRSCPNRAWGLAWAPDGRLATGCEDGVRLLVIESGRLRLLASAPSAPGARPSDIAFHPSGDRLAVGHVGVARVDVLDGQRLTPLHSPDLAGVGSGTFGVVAYSRDGRTLAAAGTWRVAQRMQMRIWADAGRGPHRDIAVSSSSVFYMRTHPAGGFVLAAADPAWGVVGPDDRWQALGVPAMADLRRGNPADVLRLAGGGSQVQFSFDWREPPHRFDLAARRLEAGALSGGRAADVQSLPITDWINTREPKLRGQPLKLADLETARSLAIAPAADSFALGSEWSLRQFAADGKPGWVSIPPAAVWGVNIDAEGPRAGKLLVAAYGDGTIRWHRMSDGRELLALFAHADRRRWVLWTPSGYYDASPGAEELIGWHVNRGPGQAADFFPAAQFRSRFNRPDVIDRILDTLDEGDALAQANVASNRRQDAPVSVAQSLPPVVEVVGDTLVRTDAPRLPVRVRVRSGDDAPVTGWRVRVDGQLVIDESGAPATGQSTVAGGAQGVERILTVPLPPRDSEIQVLASNRFGASVPALVRIVRTPAGQAAGPGPAPAPTPTPDFRISPKLYVLAVGVGAYQNPAISRLDLAAKDARDFAAAMQRQRGRLYREVEVRLLTDAQATADSVIDGLDWLGRQVTQHDVGMVFIAGHGMNDPELGYTYLAVNADPDRLRRTTVPMEEFRKTLSRLPGKAVFFLDTCHSGNVLGPRARNVVNDVSRVINELASAENGVVVFSSSTGRQLSYEDASWGNGAFTKALVEGLEGRADYQKSGRVTHKMLDLWVSERVKELTRGRQSPVTQAPGGVPDFPIAIVR